MSRRPISRAAKWILPLAWYSLALLSCDIFDIFPPEVKIISPTNNASYANTLTIELKATDNRNVTKVEVFLDGVSVHEFTKEPYEASLDISGRSAGTKTFKAIAYDKAGNHSDAELQVSVVKETVSTPNAPSGSSSGNVNTPYSFSTGGANSNAGHSLEYRFYWDDGDTSSWSSSTSASHSWSSTGTYSVKAQARCATHTSVESEWSSSKTVTIGEGEPTETVSTPNTPSGPNSGFIDSSYTYSTSGANSNAGHSLEYRFDWGGGNYSRWSSSTSASNSWSSAGTKPVKAQARCASHTSVVSSWSSSRSVTISAPTETVSTPSTPSGPSSGETNTSYTYSTGGSSSSLGHSLQYRFYWEDGDTTSWSSSTGASHSWSSAGTYYVKAQARCATHTGVLSKWSAAKAVTIWNETINTPSTPAGPSSGNVGTTYGYSTGGASSNLGHSVEYSFDWGDGSFSSWTSATSASHAWSSAGTYLIKAQARCATHTSVLSSWSDSESVTAAIWEPVLIGRYETRGAVAVHVDSAVAYMANVYAGLQILDVSNPANPFLAGNVAIPGAVDVYVSEDIAYVIGEGSGLISVDVSNATSPSLLGSINTPGYALGVFVSGSYAYVADFGRGLQVIDVTNPGAPSLVGNYDTPDRAYSVFVMRGYAHIADGESGLQMIDVTNPSTPFLAGSYDTPWADHVYVDGDYAYVCDRSYTLQVIRVSDPANPSLVSSYGTQNSPSGIFVLDGYAYMAVSRSGLQILDVTDPASPILVGRYDTPGQAADVYVSGSYAYVADYDPDALTNSGLLILDISGLP